MNSMNASQSSSMQYAPPSAPQTTDMEHHVGRAHDINARLDATHTALVGLVGRLYGEGETGPAATKATPKPVGAHYELVSALTDIEEAVARIQTTIARLQSLA